MRDAGLKMQILEVEPKIGWLCQPLMVTMPKTHLLGQRDPCRSAPSVVPVDPDGYPPKAPKSDPDKSLF